MLCRPGWTTLIVLNIAWLAALLVSWLGMALEYGNPVPGYWHILKRIMDILEWSAVAGLLLPVLVLLAWTLASDRARLARAYGFVLIAIAAGTVVLSLLQLARPAPAVA